MLFPWWIKYPNVNNEIQNLDWLEYTVKHLAKEVREFINLNTIKYADPILWNITSQYEANTVVIDPQTGDAYISTKAVPYGVSLSNTDYWTKIYNYAVEMDNLREQIAAANEELSTTATAPRAIGDLVWLNGLLYEVTAPMIAGDSYVVDSNCIRLTIEEYVINSVNAEKEAREVAVNAEKEAREVADAGLQTNIDNLHGLIILNALDLGFKNDGVTDNTALFNSILNDDNYSGATIYFPSGVYIINDAVQATKIVKFFGDPGTVFKATSNMDYLFTYDFTAISYYARSSGNMMEHITIDCDNKCSGLALINYLDFGLDDVAINNAKEFGVNTRPAYEGDNYGAQLNVNNCRFYNNDHFNTATAISDPAGDNLITTLNVIGYQTAFHGRGICENVHHWLNSGSNFEGSATLRIVGGIFTNIYCDTAEACVVPIMTNGYNRPISIKNAALNQNFNVTSAQSYVVKYGDNVNAQIIIDGVTIIPGSTKMVDVIPRHSKITNVVSYATTTNANYLGGEGDGSETYYNYSGTRDCNTEYNTGRYFSSTSNPLSNLPTGAVQNGELHVFKRTTNDALQIYYESRSATFDECYVYYRFLYNGTGVWRKISTAKIE